MGVKNILSCIFLFCLLFGGCTHRNKIKSMAEVQIVKSLNKGITNKIEVYHLLGEPDDVYIVPASGEIKIEYTNLKDKGKKITLMFNKLGILKDYTFHNLH